MNTLLSVADGMSLCVVNGRDYPIVRVEGDHAVIAVSNESSANNIAARVDGNAISSPEREFPYEVHLKLDRFDNMIEAKNWEELLNKHLSE